MPEAIDTNEILTRERLYDLPRQLHAKFDEKVWKRQRGKENSFHNNDHLEAVEISAIKYLDNATPENDPLEVFASLENWNKNNPDHKVDIAEFGQIARLAIRYQYTGNIARARESQGFEVDFLDGYTAGKVKGGDDSVAEERSKNIFEKAVLQSEIDNKAATIALGRELIEQTKFMAEDMNAPFARFMRVMDQVGNDMFNENKDALIGLHEEFVAENPDI